MRTNAPLRFVVIGAGIAGIEAANKISESYPDAQIFLLEQYLLLSGSSGRTPGRMGHGFHYANETAFQILESSISFQKKYPDFLIGRDKPFSDPLRHGRYYVTKTSNKSFEEIVSFYKTLQQYYKNLVEKDPSNEVFGSPHSFFKILDPSDYSDCVNLSEVVGGVETNEHLFDFQSFSQVMREYFQTHPHIVLKESTEVINLERIYDADSQTHYFQVHTRSTKDRSCKIYAADFIINSSWQNIEYINSKLDIPLKERTNRLKAVVRIRLPRKAYHLNSSFFCMGPFCMFSNLGNGEGLITCADTTNLATSSSLKISPEMEDFIDGRAPTQKRLNIARLILEGVKKYLPSLNDATIIDIRFGIVQTQGLIDIKSLTSPDSAHHYRNYLGVREEMQGLISNPAVKLFNAVENGEEVLRLVELQILRAKFYQSLLSQFFSSYPELDTQVNKSEILLNQLDKMLLPIDLDLVQQKHFLDQLFDVYSRHNSITFPELLLKYEGGQLKVSYNSKSMPLELHNFGTEDLTDSETDISGRSYEDKHHLLSLSDQEVSKSLEDFPIFRPLEADVKEKILAIKLIPAQVQAKELEWQTLIKNEMLYNEAYDNRPGSALGFFKSNSLDVDLKPAFRSLSSDEISGWTSNYLRKKPSGK